MLDKSKKVISLFFLLALFSAYQVWAQTKLDSLKAQLDTVEKENLPELYMDLFVASLEDYATALNYANLASQTSLAVGDSLNYVRAEYALGFLYKRDGLFNQAITHYLRAVESARINNYPDREKSSLNGLALSYYRLSQFDLALRYHFESLELREQGGDLEEIAIATNNIGLVYYQLNDFNKARLYFDRTLKLEKEKGLNSVYGTYVNLGLSNIELGRNTEALDQFNEVISNCGEDCSQQTLLEAYYGRGLCLLQQGKSSEAIEDYLVALSIARNNNIDFKIPSIFNGLIKLGLTTKNYSLAEQYLDSTQNIVKTDYRPKNLKDYYENYAEFAYSQNDFKTAYEYQVLYDSLSNEILNEVLAKNLLQIQVDFQEKENLEIIALKNKEISRATTFLFFALIIAFLTAFIVVLLYRNNRSRKRVNQKLYLANETIEEQNAKLTELNSALEERVRARTEELRKSNAALIKSNHDLDNFIYKTSHDIRGPLATLQGVCNIALMDISDPMSVDYFQKLSKTALKLNRILSKLLIVNQINNSSPTLEDTHFAELIEDIVEENKMGYREKPIRVEVKGKSNLRVKTDKELIKIVASNLINNAFKFHNTATNVESFIEVAYEENDQYLSLKVTDNGLGIDDSIAEQIFDIFSKTSEVQDSAGMGLYLVKLAVDRLGGKVSATKDDKGNTLFSAKIPTGRIAT